MVGMPSRPEKQLSQKLMNELDEESCPRYPDCDDSQQNSQMLENNKVPFKDLPRAFNMLGKMCRDLKTIPDSMHIEDCPGLAGEGHFGGSASVSPGIYQGQKVAVKTLRLYITSDYDECFSVGPKSRYCWISTQATLRRNFAEKLLPGGTYDTKISSHSLA